MIINKQQRITWSVWGILAFFIAGLMAWGLFGDGQSASPKTARKSLNISWFVFRDLNLDGIYNIGDRPYAGLLVKLFRNGKLIGSSRSNVNGFANFRMSRNPEHGVIVEQGSYKMVASTPKNWLVTSGADNTSVSFQFHEFAPAGIIADSIPDGLGVAPVANISGKLVEESVVYVLSAENNKAEELIPASDDGVITALCNRPEILIKVTDKAGAKPSKHSIQCGFFSTRLSATYFNAQDSIENPDEILVDYDNLNRSDALTKIPNGYAGLNWHNWIATHNLFYNGSGYVNATISGDYINYNSSGHPATISRSTPFDFVSTHISIAWPGARRGDVILEGFRNGEQVYIDRLQLHESGPVNFLANYFDVTEVRISSEDYWQVILENSIFRL